MAFHKKPLPPPSLKLVFKPQSDTGYTHFEGALDAPFDPTAVFSRVNAWWLADASLLSYWEPAVAQQRFHDLATLDSVPFHSGEIGIRRVEAELRVGRLPWHRGGFDSRHHHRRTVRIR